MSKRSILLTIRLADEVGPPPGIHVPPAAQMAIECCHFYGEPSGICFQPAETREADAPHGDTE